MRILLVASATLLLAAATPAQPRSGFDLATSEIVTISSGDLGSGRIVARFLVTPAQRERLLRRREAVGAVEPAGDNGVIATKSFTLLGRPDRDGVADCTLRTTTCFVIPRNPDAPILIVNPGSREGR